VLPVPSTGGVHVLRDHQNIIQAAGGNGVRHIVAVSGPDAAATSPFCYAIASGCAVSIAPASIFAEFVLRFLTRARVRREIATSRGRRIALVSRADVDRDRAALALRTPTSQRRAMITSASMDHVRPTMNRDVDRIPAGLDAQQDLTGATRSARADNGLTGTKRVPAGSARGAG
jgi:hypothetical protein